MKKAEYNKTGTRMIIDTGWKTFDKQVKLISTGNVFTDTQLSLFVRPYSMTECNSSETSTAGIDIFCMSLISLTKTIIRRSGLMF